MARSLEELQKRYNKAAVETRRRGPGPGGRRNREAHGKPKNIGKTIGRLWTYVAKYKYLLFVVLLCMLISTVTALIGSYIMRPIINTVADPSTPANERLEYLGHILLVLAGVFAVGVVSNYFQQRIMVKVSFSASEALRNDLFDKLEGLPLRYFDSESTGGIMSRFTNDIDNIDMMLNSTLTQLVSGTITLIGTFCFMIYTSRWLTLVTVAFVPLLLKSGQFIAKRSSKYYSSQQAAIGAVNGYIEETVTGQKVVKVFNYEKNCVEEFDELNHDMRSKQFGAQFWGGLMGPVLGNTTQICYAVTAGVGGLLCLFGRFDVGGMSIFANYSRQFSQPINAISQQTSTVFAALAGAERVFSVMDAVPENVADVVKYTPEEIKGYVELKDVSFGYIEGKTVLKHLSLKAEPGKKTAFVGSTGAGKTTITNLINRFYDINEGEITVDGVNIKDYDRSFLRQNIAMVLQDTHLFTGTVMENIRYGRPDATDEEVIDAAKTASAHSFIMRLANGYQTVIEGDGSNLSQGQRQLLNIARAAVSKAPILVLDEATSSVDTRTEKHIEHGMDRLMKNRTTFIIAHRLSTVRDADSIKVLEAGEIIEEGSHDELLARGGRYYELYTGLKELD